MFHNKFNFQYLIKIILLKKLNKSKLRKKLQSLSKIKLNKLKIHYIMKSKLKSSINLILVIKFLNQFRILKILKLN